MTRHEVRKYLYDISEACGNIRRFTEGKSFAHYQADLVLRSAVERQFEIVGEALAQAVRISPELADQITSAEKIIAFRNRLIHGYSSVSDDVVWGIVEGSLPQFMAEVGQLLKGR
jgi:uncharacterized protein with HEPN domain